MLGNNKKPIVSIIAASFNHEKYVSFFIDSVLAQSNPNWELIIVDDVSSDNTVAEIKKYKDVRIKLVLHEYNKGPNAVLNTAFAHAKGKYIAFASCDDAFDVGYVEHVINTMDEHKNVGVIYCALQKMDCDNNILPNAIMRMAIKDRYAVLNHFFYLGNCLLSPGIAIRREVFQEIYPLPLAMIQYQDYKMHIDLLLNTDLYISDKPLAIYRVPSEKSGVSFERPRTVRQRQLEEDLLLDSFSKIEDVKLLEKIFGDELKPFGKISKQSIPFVLGMLALHTENKYKKLWGYKQVTHFLNAANNYDFIHKSTGFCFKNFLELADVAIDEDKEKNRYQQKYIKYKKCLRTMLIIYVLTLVGILGLFGLLLF